MVRLRNSGPFPGNVHGNKVIKLSKTDYTIIWTVQFLLIFLWVHCVLVLRVPVLCARVLGPVVPLPAFTHRELVVIKPMEEWRKCWSISFVCGDTANQRRLKETSVLGPRRTTNNK